MQTAHADITTNNPQRIINRLSKHWTHKFPVDRTEQITQIELPLGHIEMRAHEGGLNVLIQAETEDLERLKEIAASHIQRMDASAECIIEWKKP